MGRRGNPYDNAKAESFMKTLKVEAVYLMDYETIKDVITTFRASSTKSTTRDVFTQRWGIGALGKTFKRPVSLPSRLQ